MKDRICIIGQSGGPTVAINATLAGVIKTAKDKGFKKIYGMIHGVEGLLDDQYIELSSWTDKDLKHLSKTPAMYLGSCRFKIAKEDQVLKSTIITKLQNLNVTDMFYIGGNDSMDTVLKLSEYAKQKNVDIQFIGIPKTIDNDLEGTYYTPGYPSACQFVATTLLEISYDASIYPERSVTIVEIMGRDAGWLTASASLLNEEKKIIDLIYLPEIVFDSHDFIEKVKEIMQYKKHVMIAVSEGIKDSNNKYLSTSNGFKIDSFGHHSRSGCANYLKECLHREINCKIKQIELNILQRCSAHLANEYDIENAVKFGEAAVNFSLEGATGIVVGSIWSKGNLEFIKADVSVVANRVKKFPLEWIDINNCQITKDYLHYIKPIMSKDNFKLPNYMSRKKSDI